jgi:uncharacterized protein DUF2834
MKRAYLTLAILGFVVTYGLGAAFVVLHGWNVGLFWDWSIGNPAGASVVADASLSVFVFWVFVYKECKRLNMPYWWAYLAANFVFGLVTPLGVFLYNREKQLNDR